MVSPSAPASKSLAKALPRHLAEGAAKLHKDKLGDIPKKTRDHWLAAFLAAVCADFGLDDAEKSAAYWGAKLTNSSLQCQVQIDTLEIVSIWTSPAATSAKSVFVHIRL